jgi:hypothetical protein
MPNEQSSRSRRPTRRALLAGGAALGAMSVAQSLHGRAAMAQSTPQAVSESENYEAALNASGGMKAVFQSPHIEASGASGDVLNHLLLGQLKNWLNAFQFDYQMDPQELHTLSATYASANLLTYSDSIWETYAFGAKYEVIDPATGQPAVRNPFWPSRNDPNDTEDPESPTSFYQDTGIEAMQKRGTVFLT